MLTIEQFEQRLAAAQTDRECEQLLRIELPQMEPRLTEDQRDDLAGQAMAKRFHFALTAEGNPTHVFDGVAQLTS